MNSKTEKYIQKVIKYMRTTFMNKLCAIILLMIGLLVCMLTDDATGLVFIACIAVPLFFARKNYIVM